VFVINEQEEFLMLSCPRKRSRKAAWETVSGALEAGETVLQGSLREVREELGSDVEVRPLGTVHAYTFHYDSEVRYMISVCYLMAYEAGRVQPGDDMLGSEFRWMPLGELQEVIDSVVVPSYDIWLFERAVELYRLWRHQEIDVLRLGLDAVE